MRNVQLTENELEGLNLLLTTISNYNFDISNSQEIIPLLTNNIDPINKDAVNESLSLLMALNNLNGVVNSISDKIKS